MVAPTHLLTLAGSFAVTVGVLVVLELVRVGGVRLPLIARRVFDARRAVAVDVEAPSTSPERCDVGVPR